MSDTIHSHLETKIDGLGEKFDDFLTEYRADRKTQREDNADLFRRVGQNEGEIKALQQTRPTLIQLISAMATAITLAVAIAALFIT